MKRPKPRSALSLRGQLSALKAIKEACEEYMNKVESGADCTILEEAKVFDRTMEGLYGPKVWGWILEQKKNK